MQKIAVIRVIRERFFLIKIIKSIPFSASFGAKFWTKVITMKKRKDKKLFMKDVIFYSLIIWK